jgi:DNA polymerase III delta prime subunit
MSTIFDDIVGNEDALSILDSFIQADHIPNMLIAGPHGCGKSLAVNRLLCKYFNSKDDYINENFCMKLYGSIYRGKNIISEFLYKKNLDGNNNEPNIHNFIKKKVICDKIRIILIYDFDCMTEEAQMALRRIIEIYSYKVRFILLCNDRSKIIEALQSRMSIIDFTSISDDDIINYLHKLHPTVDDEINKIIALMSSGDLRYALNMCKYFTQSMDKSISVFSKLFNLQPLFELDTLFKYIYNKNFKEACKIIDKLVYSGYNVNDIAYFIIKYIYMKKIDIKYIEQLINIIQKIEVTQSHIQLYELVCAWMTITT